MDAGDVVEPLSSSAARRDRRRNLALGIASGALLLLVEAFLSPVIVLALFVSSLTDSLLLVGLAPALGAALWLLPQVLPGLIRAVSGSPRAVVIRSNAVRTAAIGLIGILGFALDERASTALLLSFFILYAVATLAAGFGYRPLTDLTLRAVFATDRGRLLSRRSLWGGVLSVGAGMLIQWILGADAALPGDFAPLFIVAFVALALATAAFAGIRVPSRAAGAPVAPEAGSVGEPGASLPVVADARLRQFASFRWILALSAIADPFYVVYAARALGAPAGVAGVYIVLMTLARFGSNLVWRPLAGRHGSRLVLQLAALARLLMPVIALALPPLLRWGPLADRLANGQVALYSAFGLVFIAYGAALGAQALASTAYVVETPPPSRPGMVGLVNGGLGVIALGPIVGGLIADQLGLELLFVLALLIDFAAVLLSGTLPETRLDRDALARGPRRPDATR